VIEESVRVQQVEREAQVKGGSGNRAPREGNSSPRAEAGGNRTPRIETLASAERQRSITEAEGRASAIRAQGEAEARSSSRRVKPSQSHEREGEAFQEYNQAAVLDNSSPDCRKWCARSASRSARWTK